MIRLHYATTSLRNRFEVIWTCFGEKNARNLILLGFGHGFSAIKGFTGQQYINSILIVQRYSLCFYRVVQKNAGTFIEL